MAVKAPAAITLSSIRDLQSCTRYYLLQSSTSAKPTKPTANPPGGNWVTAEPTYSSGSTNSLYFRVGVPAAWQHGHKNVRRPLLPGNAVRDVQWIACPVHLHGVPGLVRDAHGGLRHPRPAAVLLAKLGVRVRNAALAANGAQFSRFWCTGTAVYSLMNESGFGRAVQRIG